MKHVFKYAITEEDTGKKIGDYLKEKGYSRAICIGLKKSDEGILKNQQRAGVNELLAKGDVLTLTLKEEVGSQNILPVAQHIDILFEDDDLLVINKADDTPIHPSINNYENTLANGVMHYYKEQNKELIFRCMNRLDRDTTGITIIAKHVLSASILSEQMRKREVERIYIALVEGITKDSGQIELPIGRMENSIIMRRVDCESGKEALTYYKRMKVVEYEGKKLSLIALKLETGRTHQIRVHMAAIGHPLIGDFLYNPPNKMMKRQALHAVWCGFYHPLSGEYKKIRTPLPSDFRHIVGRLDTEELARIDFGKK